MDWLCGENGDILSPNIARKTKRMKINILSPIIIFLSFIGFLSSGQQTCKLCPLRN